MKPGAVSRHLVEGMGWSPWTIAKSVGVLRRWVAIKVRLRRTPLSSPVAVFSDALQASFIHGHALASIPHLALALLFYL